MSDFARYLYDLSIDSTKKIKQIDFKVVAEDFIGQFNLTDFQLQDGPQTTGFEPNYSELFKQLSFNIDENLFLKTVSNPKKDGNAQPKIHTDVKNRIFNIVGRGHETVVIPNVFPQDYYFTPVLTSALDINLFVKDDYDLLRIRTSEGSLISGRKYSKYPSLLNHPLNYRYSREYYFEGGKQGDTIQLKAGIKSAKVNSIIIDNPHYNVINDTGDIVINNQKFMLSPPGSFRLGIEFYKKVTETLKDNNGDNKSVSYYKDTGIGYSGYVEFNQYTYGRSKQ